MEGLASNMVDSQDSLAIFQKEWFEKYFLHAYRVCNSGMWEKPLLYCMRAPLLLYTIDLFHGKKGEDESIMLFCIYSSELCPWLRWKKFHDEILESFRPFGAIIYQVISSLSMF